MRPLRTLQHCVSIHAYTNHEKIKEMVNWCEQHCKKEFGYTSERATFIFRMPYPEDHITPDGFAYKLSEHKVGPAHLFLFDDQADYAAFILKWEEEG